MSKPLPWVKFESIGENVGRFTVSPLTRGMGTTLGNSLRRVLLSSLKGTAVTSIKIDGVSHEFSTINNVVEDVLDVICNVKALVFKKRVEDPKVLKLNVNKAGVVYANQIESDPDVEIVNADAKIAEVAKSGSLKMELTVEDGVGYRAAERLSEGQEIDNIVIDSSFSPIVRVNHQVKNIRVGKELDYDSLTLDVWTNGSVTPEDAVQSASALLAEKFSLFSTLNEEPESKESAQLADSEEEQVNGSPLEMAIDDLELSARSSNCLKRAGIETVGELVGKDLSELIKIKNFGKKSADEINAKLEQFELKLQGEV